MKRAFQIFFRDIKRLSKNRAALLVTAGVCLIPSLYAWFNIAANYDPYGNTAGIRIAVANMDRGAEHELTGRIDTGKEISDRLKENRELGWMFTTEKKAVDGVRAGTYYAAIVIPENFSESLLSILNGELKQPEICYYLNEKKNAVAPKITDTGAGTVMEKVNTEFVHASSAAAAELLSDALEKTSGEVNRLRENLTADLAAVQANIEAFEAVSEDLEHLGNTEQDTSQIRDALNKVKEVSSVSAHAAGTAGEILTASRKNTADFSALLTGAISQTDGLLVDMADTSDAVFGRVNGDMQMVSARLESAEAVVSEILERNDRMLTALGNLSSGYPESNFQEIIQALEEENNRYRQLLESIRTGRLGVENAVQSAGSASDQIRETVRKGKETLKQGKAQWESETRPKFESALDSAAGLSGEIAGMLSGTEPLTEQLEAVLENTEQSMKDAKTAVRSTGDAIAVVRSDLSEISVDLGMLRSSRFYRDLQNIEDPAAVSDFMASPVKLTETSFYPVENYGSAMAPFYTSLAVWVGGIVLIAVFKLEADRDRILPGFSATQGFFGRWLLFVAAGMIQALVICLGDLYVLKIQCVSPAAFIFAGMLASFVYVSIIYSLSITLKHIGKALSVLLVIIQIPGGAGTYPVEMTPEFFQKIHPLLPFTYAINAMREAVAGIYGWHYAQNLFCLMVYIPVFLCIGIVVRPFLLNLNRLFDDRLAQTELMICEEGGMTREHLRLAAAVKILTEDERFRTDIMKKADGFEKRYKKRVRNGFAAILILPAVFLVFMFSVNSKIIFLILWIAAVVGVSAYLICLEYMRESIRRQKEMLGMSQEELKRRLREQKGGEEEP